MESTTKKQTNLNGKSHLREAVSDVMTEGKKFANELYEDGLGKASKVEDQVKDYSDEIVIKIKENPLRSVLIAGGVGFLLSLLLKK